MRKEGFLEGRCEHVVTMAGMRFAMSLTPELTNLLLSVSDKGRHTGVAEWLLTGVRTANPPARLGHGLPRELPLMYRTDATQRLQLARQR